MLSVFLLAASQHLMIGPNIHVIFKWSNKYFAYIQLPHNIYPIMKMFAGH